MKIKKSLPCTKNWPFLLIKLTIINIFALNYQFYSKDIFKMYRFYGFYGFLLKNDNSRPQKPSKMAIFDPRMGQYPLGLLFWEGFGDLYWLIWSLWGSIVIIRARTKHLKTKSDNLMVKSHTYLCKISVRIEKWAWPHKSAIHTMVFEDNQFFLVNYV